MLYGPTLSPAPLTLFLVRDHPWFGYAALRDDLREFISFRLDQVDPYQESKEYCRQQEKASRLNDELAAMLPVEGRAILLTYSEALGDAHYLEEAILTERAFVDGMRIVLKAVMS